MTEQFNKAASVLLSHRLNNLLRINENVEIDMGYITCAEYQLFINEKSGSGEYLQPEHWNNYRFPNGDAKKSITGVRSIHAEEFCKWLTQRELSLLYKYRLPNLDEALKYPIQESDFGYWCQDGNLIIIKGINQIKSQAWATTLSNIFNNHLKDIYDIDIIFGTHIISFAAKIQVLTKSSQHSDIHDFVRRIYNLSSHQLETANLTNIIHELEKLNRLKNVININNSHLTFSKFTNPNKYAVLETLKLTVKNIVDNLNFKINQLESELNLILKDLWLLEKQLKATKSSLFVDMNDLNNNVIFGKEKIELINPITGNDESIYLPVITNETTSLVSFGNIKIFRELILQCKKDLQKLQKEILEKRTKFTDTNNSLRKQKDIYEDNSVKIPKILKIIDSLENNEFHLLISCAICIWVQKINLAQDIFELYLYLILLKERREGRIPAWEGIRIVRERL